MTFRELKQVLFADLYRYHGRANLGLLVWNAIINPGFCYTFWMRLCGCLLHKGRLALPGFLFCRLMLRHYAFKYGISIPYNAPIGPGFHLGHFGGITVSSRARIGRNCNLSQDVTIGVSNRGSRAGVPCIGDNVYIGPGAKLFGGISIGNNVAVGANCVVTRDVPDNAVVVGIPGRVISYNGAQDYIARTDYDQAQFATDADCDGTPDDRPGTEPRLSKRTKA